MTSIIVGLILLMVLAYLGWSIIWIAPLVAGLVALMNGIDLLPAYTETYMTGFVTSQNNGFLSSCLGPSSES